MRDFTEEIDKGLTALYKLEASQSKQKDLLAKGKIVYLQISLFKIPHVRRRRRKFLSLCHSLYGDDPEICLFVPNRKTGVEYKKTTDEFIEFCVDYYTELLEKHEVKGIKTVMPVKQLRSEYGTYELRRKLAQRFDIFLCKNSLLYNSRFLTALGKIFRVAKKEPFGVAFPKGGSDYDPDFSKSVRRALFASAFFIQPYSDNYSIPIGTLSHSKVQLKENLKTVLDQLFSKNLIPGGFQNIKAMYIWPSQSKAIPLYVCMELPTNLKRPRVKSQRKRVKTVEGELSTQPGKKVTVTPRGDVFLSTIEGDSERIDVDTESGDDSFEEGSDEGGAEEALNSKARSGSEAKAPKEKESGSEDDEEIEEREQRLLKVKRETEEKEERRAAKKSRTENGKQTFVVGSKMKKKENDVKKALEKQNGKVNSERKKRVANDKDTSGNNKKVTKLKRKLLIKKEKMMKTEKVKQKKKRSINH